MGIPADELRKDVGIASIFGRAYPFSVTFDELAKTDLFCILFERQYGFVFRRLGTRDDMTFTADPIFSDIVQQAGEYWGHFQVGIHTTAGDAKGLSTGIFRVLILRPLEGDAERILAGADFSVKIETAPGGVLNSMAAAYYFVSPCLPPSSISPQPERIAEDH